MRSVQSCESNMVPDRGRDRSRRDRPLGGRELLGETPLARRVPTVTGLGRRPEGPTRPLDLSYPPGSAEASEGGIDLLSVPPPQHFRKLIPGHGMADQDREGRHLEVADVAGTGRSLGPAEDPGVLVEDLRDAVEGLVVRWLYPRFGRWPDRESHVDLVGPDAVQDRGQLVERFLRVVQSLHQHYLYPEPAGELATKRLQSLDEAIEGEFGAWAVDPLVDAFVACVEGRHHGVGGCEIRPHVGKVEERAVGQDSDGQPGRSLRGADHRSNATVERWLT